MVLAAAVKSDDGMMKIMEECKASVGASDEDVAKFIGHAPLDSKPQMCLFACLMGSMNVVRLRVLAMPVKSVGDSCKGF